MADSKAKTLSLKRDLKSLASYTGKGIIKHLDNISRHDGVQKALVIGGIAATTYFLTPLAITAVGGLTAAKWAADKLSDDPHNNNKGLLDEFKEVTGYGANILGKASELILSPRLNDLSKSIDDWEHNNTNTKQPEPEPEQEK